MKKLKTILVVDQDTELTNILSCYFQFFDVKVAPARRISEAVMKIDRQAFEAIFIEVDHNPDKIDRILESLAEKGHLNEKTPLVAMSMNHEASFPDNFHSRVTAVIEKPFTFSAFKEALRRCQI